MDWRHQRELLAAGEDVYSKLMNLCVWNKSNAGMGSLYRSKHELVFVFKVGKGAHINNVALGRYGRHRTNVWDYVSQNALSGTAKGKLALHPTVKPVAMIADAIRDCSNRGGLILDPFGGAGTTLIAAERTGRRARVIELNPIFVDVSIERWQRLTGGTARHAESGQPFVRVWQRPGGRYVEGEDRCPGVKPLRRPATARRATRSGMASPRRHSQYRPGQSGYPAGRRKGVRNLKTDVKRTLTMPVKVKEGGRTRTRSTQEAALMVLREKALNGNTRALERLLELALRFNNDEAGQAQQLPADDQAILAAYVADWRPPQ